jgi:hypothetical protein
MSKLNAAHLILDQIVKLRRSSPASLACENVRS